MNTKFFILIRLLITFVLFHIGFIGAFLLRYNLHPPQKSIRPYYSSWIFLTLIVLGTLAAFQFFKSRFMSSYHLFCRTFWGLGAGTIACIAFIYVFRSQWGAFPTSVFIIAFPINSLLIFKVNQWILKKRDGIRKNIIAIGRIGKADIKGIFGRISVVHNTTPDSFKQLKTDFRNIDQIIIAEEIKDAKLLENLTLITQRFDIDLVFTPAVYMRLLRNRIDGNGHYDAVKTFEGRRRDAEELIIRLLDVSVAFAGLVVMLPLIGIVAAAIKLTSRGPVFYTQSRVGKDGQLFVIYKFRTMYRETEITNVLVPATLGDPRVTSLGYFLRQYRLDEVPQFLNILKGDMSLVGPRPENVFRVNLHKALQGIRLAVKPGLTGLAQIRGLYDLSPRHKLKYDYLYIQRRSLRLNMYILLNTLPALFKMKGW